MENTVTLGGDPSSEAVITVLPSLPIHSSVLVALIAGLFLAALIVRAQRLPSEASADSMMQRASRRVVRSARRRARSRLRRRQARAERRARMTASTTRDRARVAEQPQAARSGTVRTELSGLQTVEDVTGPDSSRGVQPQKKAQQETASQRGSSAVSQGFRIRWGRALVALVGLCALLTTVVTAPLAALTPLLISVPLTAGGVLLVSLITLRSMAVSRRRRRRRKRLEAAMAEAMNPALSVEERRRPGVPSTAGTARGVDAGKARQQEPTASGQTASMVTSVGEAAAPQDVASRREVDEDGLPVDIAATFDEAQAHQASSMSQAPAAQGASAAESRQGWQPRDVPKPHYLEAEKAERSQPEPLVPEEPKPTTEVKIREDLPTTGVSPAPAKDSEGGELAATGTDGGYATASAHPAGVQQSLDLDAVLKRRRA